MSHLLERLTRILHTPATPSTSLSNQRTKHDRLTSVERCNRWIHFVKKLDILFLAAHYALKAKHLLGDQAFQSLFQKRQTTITQLSQTAAPPRFIRGEIVGQPQDPGDGKVDRAKGYGSGNKS